MLRINYSRLTSGTMVPSPATPATAVASTSSSPSASTNSIATASNNPIATASTNTIPPSPLVSTNPTILDKLNKRIERLPGGSEYTFKLQELTLESVFKLIESDRQLLLHPVIESFLSAVWRKSHARKLFFGFFWLYVIFIVWSAYLLGMIGNPIWQTKGKFKKK